ncbi:unnamed protein product, partial [Rotaria sp. Silwood1]
TVMNSVDGCSSETIRSRCIGFVPRRS